MHIRNASTVDIPLIRELTMQVWPQTYTPIVGETQVSYMLSRFYNPEALSTQMDESGHRFIIGYYDGQPVAFASYSGIEPGIYKLHKLYIILQMQGNGIGRSMIAHIVNEIKSSKALALRLNVNRYNTSAMAFYAKTGFKHFAEEDIDIGNGYFMNDYVLSLDIE